MTFLSLVSFFVLTVRTDSVFIRCKTVKSQRNTTKDTAMRDILALFALLIFNCGLYAVTQIFS